MSAIANPSTAFSSSQTSSTFSLLPVVLGVTAAGQPLISNLVSSSSSTKIEQPPQIPQSDGKLILSGILANGKPIVQGITSPQENNFFNAHSISETENLKTDSTATPAHSEISCESFVIIHGGISKNGIPLIQGLTLIPEIFSETLPTATPPSSLIGEGECCYFEKENNSFAQEEFFQKPPERPLFNNNQSLPDFSSDNAQEEECTLIQAQQEGVFCNDEFSHKIALPQENLLTNKTFLHSSSPIDDTKLSISLSYILSNLAKLKMVNQSQYSDVVERLYELEEEMKDAATGLPPDPSLTDLIGKILSAEYPNADLQIIVSSSRKTTTTKSFYETETPGMVGLEPDKLQELQRKLMTNISSPESAKDAAAPGAVPPGLHVPDAEIHPDAAVQKKEVHEEGYANADGSETVAKKMTRVITTSQSAVSGVNEQPAYESREDSDTASVSNVSMGSVRDRIAIFESLKEKEFEISTKPEERRESVTLPLAVEAGIVGAAVATFDQMSTTSSKAENETHISEDEGSKEPLQEEMIIHSNMPDTLFSTQEPKRIQPDTDENVTVHRLQSETISGQPENTDYIQHKTLEEKEEYSVPYSVSESINQSQVESPLLQEKEFHENLQKSEDTFTEQTSTDETLDRRAQNETEAVIESQTSMTDYPTGRFEGEAHELQKSGEIEEESLQYRPHDVPYPESGDEEKGPGLATQIAGAVAGVTVGGAILAYNKVKDAITGDEEEDVREEHEYPSEYAHHEQHYEKPASPKSESPVHEETYLIEAHHEQTNLIDDENPIQETEKSQIADYQQTKTLASPSVTDEELHIQIKRDTVVQNIPGGFIETERITVEETPITTEPPELIHSERLGDKHVIESPKSINYEEGAEYPLAHAYQEPNTETQFEPEAFEDYNEKDVTDSYLIQALQEKNKSIEDDSHIHLTDHIEIGNDEGRETPATHQFANDEDIQITTDTVVQKHQEEFNDTQKIYVDEQQKTTEHHEYPHSESISEKDVIERSESPNYEGDIEQHQISVAAYPTGHFEGEPDELRKSGEIEEEALQYRPQEVQYTGDEEEKSTGLATQIAGGVAGVTVSGAILAYNKVKDVITGDKDEDENVHDEHEYPSEYSHRESASEHSYEQHKIRSEEQSPVHEEKEPVDLYLNQDEHAILDSPAALTDEEKRAQITTETIVQNIPGGFMETERIIVDDNTSIKEPDELIHSDRKQDVVESPESPIYEENVKHHEVSMTDYPTGHFEGVAHELQKSGEIEEEALQHRPHDVPYPEAGDEEKGPGLATQIAGAVAGVTVGGAILAYNKVKDVITGDKDEDEDVHEEHEYPSEYSHQEQHYEKHERFSHEQQQSPVQEEKDVTDPYLIQAHHEQSEKETLASPVSVTDAESPINITTDTVVQNIPGEFIKKEVIDIKEYTASETPEYLEDKTPSEKADAEDPFIEATDDRVSDSEIDMKENNSERQQSTEESLDIHSPIDKVVGESIVLESGKSSHHMKKSPEINFSDEISETPQILTEELSAESLEEKSNRAGDIVTPNELIIPENISAEHHTPGTPDSEFKEFISSEKDATSVSVDNALQNENVIQEPGSFIQDENGERISIPHIILKDQQSTASVAGSDILEHVPSQTSFLSTNEASNEEEDRTESNEKFAPNLDTIEQRKTDSYETEKEDMTALQKDIGGSEQNSDISENLPYPEAGDEEKGPGLATQIAGAVAGVTVGGAILAYNKVKDAITGDKDEEENAQTEHEHEEQEYPAEYAHREPTSEHFYEQHEIRSQEQSPVHEEKDFTDPYLNQTKHQQDERESPVSPEPATDKEKDIKITTDTVVQNIPEENIETEKIVDQTTTEHQELIHSESIGEHGVIESPESPNYEEEVDQYEISMADYPTGHFEGEAHELQKSGEIEEKPLQHRPRDVPYPGDEEDASAHGHQEPTTENRNEKEAESTEISMTDYPTGHFEGEPHELHKLREIKEESLHQIPLNVPYPEYVEGETTLYLARDRKQQGTIPTDISYLGEKDVLPDRPQTPLEDGDHAVIETAEEMGDFNINPRTEMDSSTTEATRYPTYPTGHFEGEAHELQKSGEIEEQPLQHRPHDVQYPEAGDEEKGPGIATQIAGAVAGVTVGGAILAYNKVKDAITGDKDEDEDVHDEQEYASEFSHQEPHYEQHEMFSREQQQSLVQEEKDVTDPYLIQAQHEQNNLTEEESNIHPTKQSQIVDDPEGEIPASPKFANDEELHIQIERDTVIQNIPGGFVETERIIVEETPTTTDHQELIHSDSIGEHGVIENPESPNFEEDAQSTEITTEDYPTGHFEGIPHDLQKFEELKEQILNQRPQHVPYPEAGEVHDHEEQHTEQRQAISVYEDNKIVNPYLMQAETDDSNILEGDNQTHSTARDDGMDYQERESLASPESVTDAKSPVQIPSDIGIQIIPAGFVETQRTFNDEDLITTDHHELIHSESIGEHGVIESPESPNYEEDVEQQYEISMTDYPTGHFEGEAHELRKSGEIEEESLQHRPQDVQYPEIGDEEKGPGLATQIAGAVAGVTVGGAILAYNKVKEVIAGDKDEDHPYDTQTDKATTLQYENRDETEVLEENFDEREIKEANEFDDTFEAKQQEAEYVPHSFVGPDLSTVEHMPVQQEEFENLQNKSEQELTTATYKSEDEQEQTSEPSTNEMQTFDVTQQEERLMSPLQAAQSQTADNEVPEYAAYTMEAETPILKETDDESIQSLSGDIEEETDNTNKKQQQSDVHDVQDFENKSETNTPLTPEIKITQTTDDEYFEKTTMFNPDGVSEAEQDIPEEHQQEQQREPTNYEEDVEQHEMSITDYPTGQFEGEPHELQKSGEIEEEALQHRPHDVPYPEAGDEGKGPGLATQIAGAVAGVTVGGAILAYNKVKDAITGDKDEYEDVHEEDEYPSEYSQHYEKHESLPYDQEQIPIPEEKDVTDPYLIQAQHEQSNLDKDTSDLSHSQSIGASPDHHTHEGHNYQSEYVHEKPVYEQHEKHESFSHQDQELQLGKEDSSSDKHTDQQNVIGEDRHMHPSVQDTTYNRGGDTFVSHTVLTDEEEHVQITTDTVAQDIPGGFIETERIIVEEIPITTDHHELIHSESIGEHGEIESPKLVNYEEDAEANNILMTDYPSGHFAGAPHELQKVEDIYEESLQQRPHDVPYPENKEETSPSDYIENERIVDDTPITTHHHEVINSESLGETDFIESPESPNYAEQEVAQHEISMADYPTGHFEGEPDELRKSGEIEEEPLQYRPQEVQYPGDEEEKGPGIATQIAGAVAGVTVGGAILAYNKVKDAITGDKDEEHIHEELEYPSEYAHQETSSYHEPPTQYFDEHQKKELLQENLGGAEIETGSNTLSNESLPRSHDSFEEQLKTSSDAEKRTSEIDEVVSSPEEVEVSMKELQQEHEVTSDIFHEQNTGIDKNNEELSTTLDFVNDVAGAIAGEAFSSAYQDYEKAASDMSGTNIGDSSSIVTSDIIASPDAQNELSLRTHHEQYIEDNIKIEEPVSTEIDFSAHSPSTEDETDGINKTKQSQSEHAIDKILPSGLVETQRTTIDENPTTKHQEIIHSESIDEHGVTVSPKPTNYEEEVAQHEISMSDYPTGRFEGEAHELQKSGEIEEEYLQHRPHDVPYPGDEEEKGPGLATQIAGAVAGVTVGGAILAYNKVKDVITGDKDEDEDVHEEHENPSEYSHREQHYEKRESFLHEQVESPVHEDKDVTDPYLIQAQHEQSNLDKDTSDLNHSQSKNEDEDVHEEHEFYSEYAHREPTSEHSYEQHEIRSQEQEQSPVHEEKDFTDPYLNQTKHQQDERESPVSPEPATDEEKDIKITTDTVVQNIPGGFIETEKIVDLTTTEHQELIHSESIVEHGVIESPESPNYEEEVDQYEISMADYPTGHFEGEAHELQKLGEIEEEPLQHRPHDVQYPEIGDEEKGPGLATQIAGAVAGVTVGGAILAYNKVKDAITGDKDEEDMHEEHEYPSEYSHDKQLYEKRESLLHEQVESPVHEEKGVTDPYLIQAQHEQNDFLKNESDLYETEHPIVEEDIHHDSASVKSINSDEKDVENIGDYPTGNFEGEPHKLQKSDEISVESLQQRPLDVPYPDAESLFNVKTPDALVHDLEDKLSSSPSKDAWEEPAAVDESSDDLFNIQEPMSYLSADEDYSEAGEKDSTSSNAAKNDLEFVQSENVPTEPAIFSNFDEEALSASRKSSKAEDPQNQAILQHQDSASSLAAVSSYSPEGSEAERSSQSTVIRVSSITSQKDTDIEKQTSEEELVDSETPITIKDPLSATFGQRTEGTQEHFVEHTSDKEAHLVKLDIDENQSESTEPIQITTDTVVQNIPGAFIETQRIIIDENISIKTPDELIHSESIDEHGVIESPESPNYEKQEVEQHEISMSDYPTGRFEGEPHELQKSGEIEEEPLQHRPHDVQYPEAGDKEKGPGLATQIAGAVAGVTVGGAILAYNKVKDAITGDKDEEDMQEGHEYSSEYAHHEQHYEKHERFSHEQQQSPVQEENDLTDPYLIQAQHEHGERETIASPESVIDAREPIQMNTDTVIQHIPGGFIESQPINLDERHSLDDKTPLYEVQETRTIGFTPVEISDALLTGEPLTESQIADTPSDDKQGEDDFRKEEYELIENDDVWTSERNETIDNQIMHSPRIMQEGMGIESEEEAQRNKIEDSEQDSQHESMVDVKTQQYSDPMIQSIHPDYTDRGEESPDNFELIETEHFGHVSDEIRAQNEPETTNEEEDWQKVSEHEDDEIKSLHKTEDSKSHFLEEKPSSGFNSESTKEIEKGDDDFENVEITQKTETTDETKEESEFALNTQTTSAHKIDEHAEELVRDVLEQIENENLMDMSLDSLNLHDNDSPRITNNEREISFENQGMEDSLNIEEQPTSSEKMLGVQQDIPAFRPSSPVPPAFRTAEKVAEEEENADERMEVDSLNEESGSSGEASVVDATKKKKHISYDNVSESSLQEFERLEYELRENVGESPSSENADYEKVGESQTGSISSLVEFENIEREVRENTLAQAATAEEVMMLSDIREESEIEEMSIREDDEDEEDSLSESKPPQIGHDERQSHYPAETMLTSTDSLEAVIRQPILLETSTDSLESRQNYNFSPNQNEHDEYTSHQTDQDSLLEGVSQSNLSQETQMLSGDTVATYQEYQDDDEDDKDSLTDVITSYPTTLTTFETVQRKNDGSVETISRRVMTRVTDPVHSRVRFTGTEDENRLHNIPVDHPVETVDEEGNVTTTQCRRTPTN